MRKLVLLLVVALLGISLAACNGSREIKVQGVTATEIKVGNTASKTGAFAAVGVPFSAAIEAVFEEYNKTEGVVQKIKYITYDDATDASVGQTNTKKLIEEDKVFAIVGHVGTGTVGATLPYIQEKGVPMVYAATGINDLYFEKAEGNPIFAVQPIYRTDGRIAYARATNEAIFGAKKDEKLAANAKIGVLYTNDDAGKSILAGIQDEAKLANNEANLIVKSFLSDTVESVVKSMLDSNPDVIIVAGNQLPFNEALIALDDNDNTKPVITSYVNTNASSITVRPYGFDIYGSAWIDIVDPQGLAGFSQAYWDFVATMTAAGYGNPNAADNYTANAFAMAGYVAAKVFLAGLANVEGELTFKSFIEAMESEPIQVPMGGQIDFSEGKRWGISSMALSKLVYTAAVVDNPDTEANEAKAASHAFIKVRNIESLDKINAK